MGDVVALDVEIDTQKSMARSPVELVWNDLSCFVDTSKFCRKSRQTILQGVSGKLAPGQLLGIMGPSGSGKTTLLNVLAGRIPKNVGTSGTVLVNGIPLSHRIMRQCCAYLQQDDILLPLLTVKETIKYAAMLRLPAKLTDNQKMAQVRDTIDKLGLDKCRNTYVRDISGGERKRTAIGVELVSNPGLLVLDEPTSGLDSKTSLALIEALGTLAHDHGLTVMCSIHQPRSRIFHKFDMLLLLAAGQVVYFGPSGEPAVTYFTRLGYACPQLENPADYFMDLVTRDPVRKAESEAQTKLLLEAYQKPPEYTSSTSFPPGYLKKHKGASIFEEFMWLFERSVKSLARNTAFLAIRVVQTIMVAIVIGVIFFDIGNDQSTINDRDGLLILCLINNAFNEVFAVLGTFPPERRVFQKEVASGTYRVVSYYFAKQLAEFPIQAIFPIVFTIIVYWMAGLQATIIKFLIFSTIVVSTAFVANSLGLVLSATLDVAAAGALAPLTVIFSLLFAGFFVIKGNIPVFLRWLCYCSFMRYGWSGLMVNEFTGLTLTCTDSQLVGNPPTCPITNGSQVLNTIEIEHIDPYQAILILFAFILGIRALLYIALRYLQPSVGGRGG